MTPWLFLDIDGVLNALGGKTDWPDSFDVDVPSGPKTYRLNLSRDMADAINSLDVHIIWCTTWQQDAWRVGQHLDISAPFLILDKPGWKRGAVEQFLIGYPRPFIWVDDEPGLYGMELLKSMDHLPEHLLINPKPTTGLTQADIVRIQDWTRDGQD